jgi:hypothetical protein
MDLMEENGELGIYTARRTSMPTNIVFVGLNGTCWEVELRRETGSDKENGMKAWAYEASCLAKDSRKCMDNFDYGAKVVYQVAILVSIIFERGFSFWKYFEKVIGGVAVLEHFCRRMIDKVYSCLLGIAFQCGIEDGLNVGRGGDGWRHDRSGVRWVS